MSETAYQTPAINGARLQHKYGDNVHILSDPWSLSMMARLSSPETHAPALHHMLLTGCRHLIHAAVEQLPMVTVDQPTRMMASEPKARYQGSIIDPTSRVIIVDIARGGMLPSHVFQLELLELVSPEQIRVDHIYMQRVADPETGAVTGIELSGSKIGGDATDATVFIPDPMGATGRSIEHVLAWYQQELGQPPSKLVTCHLIITPEYLRRITTTFPDVAVYALRLDRGLSSQRALDAMPGTYWDEERGLDKYDYIIPGAGGLGELINNTP